MPNKEYEKLLEECLNAHKESSDCYGQFMYEWSGHGYNLIPEKETIKQATIEEMEKCNNLYKEAREKCEVFKNFCQKNNLPYPF